MLILLAFTIVVILSILYYIYWVHAPLPEVDYNAWWGPEGESQEEDTTIRPFKIEFGENMVQDLKHRLQNTRSLTSPLEGVGFQYGFNTDELKKWLKYWAENYNFAEREKEMNRYPHFKTRIQGLDIHFMRVKPQVPPGVEVLPLLILHGWPGSIREFYEAIPHLTAISKVRDFALEIIAPSLPGYGYSESTSRPGFGAPEMAVVLRNLMRRLGYQKFYVQGGDWGAYICSIMATIFPKEILGYHSNLFICLSFKTPLILGLFSFFNTLLVRKDLVKRIYPLSKTFSFLLEELGYFHQLATKPDTIGVAMADSPAGLLAFTVEKFCVATNPSYRARSDGGLGLHYTKDQILDNLMMYWAPNSFTTSGRLYAESVAKMFRMRIDDVPTEVPTWVIQAKNEVLYLPPAVIRLKSRNLVGVTTIKEGGHFLALEMPEEFSRDVLHAVQEFRKFWKVKNGL